VLAQGHAELTAAGGGAPVQQRREVVAGSTEPLGGAGRTRAPPARLCTHLLADRGARGVVGRNCLRAARAGATGQDGLYPTRTRKMSVFGGEII